MKSLFYQGDGRKPYILESLSTGKQTYLFNNKETRAFIAENYDEHADIIDTAMTNEHSRLKSVLYGYSVESADQYNAIAFSAAGITINALSAHGIKLSKSLYDEAESIYVTFEKADESGLYLSL